MSDYSCPKCEYSGSWMGINVHHSKAHGKKLNKSEYLIKDINRVYENLGRVPTRREYDNQYGNFTSKSCEDCFGSWNNALRECGFSVHTSYDYTEDDLIEELQRLSDELGRSPYYNEMKKLSKYSHKLYTNMYGTWNDALKAAKLSINKEMDISRQDLLDEIVRIYEVVGRPPTSVEMNNFGKYSSETYYQKFGGWNKAVEKAGLTPYKKYSKDTDTKSTEYELRKWSEKVKRRDNYKCVECGDSNELHAHHIKRKSEYPENVLDLDNGKTLCIDCHIDAHSGEACQKLLKSSKGLNRNSSNN